jgi:hypothetical protein
LLLCLCVTLIAGLAAAPRVATQVQQAAIQGTVDEASRAPMPA